jgi:hypothetical protein
MVQTDLTQLNRECSSWIECLRNHRSDITGYRLKLQEVVSQPINKAALPQVEHYDNQFDIQLKNINHLKHAIKEHEKLAAWDLNRTSGPSNESLWAAHEDLHDQYESLDHTISDLKQEFNSFISNIG